MTAYVRVRKHDELVQRIDETGTQVDVAAAAGLSTQRVNQLYTGAHAILEVRKARRLEEALGVDHGALFSAVDAALLAPYLHADDPDDGPGNTDDRDPASDTAPDTDDIPSPPDIPPAADTPAHPTVSASAA